MENIYSSDCESTMLTLLRHTLDTADSCTPRRRRSARISAQRALLETPSPKRWSGQTKATASQCSHGARSTGRLARGQAVGHLEEQTPRTLLKNILLTAPESSIVMPERVMPVERKTLEMVEKCLDKYLEHLCNDLEVFAAHAGCKTVKPEDLELLMRSGNSVFPAQ
ncbi:Centromere protein T [Heterocephalus glaber]|uniref:Centromere protein S n=1 Tax=Heterocephalus glaber TaxID=10181 RepID=G5AQ93_HETGA|nr:Centromere protein T [Heterocephalus glaber]